MKKNILAFLLLLGCTVSQAQVGVGVPNPDASSALELKSTTKGFLLPRMTTIQRTAITTPATGLQVYDTDTNTIWYRNTTIWKDTGGTTSVVDASTTAKGIIQLVGDLSGTATAPTIAADAVTTAKILDGTIVNADLNTGVGGIYKGSGSLSAATTVTGDANTLAFTSTVSNGFSIDGTTFSVDASSSKHYVGIGTTTPLSKLEVNGAATNIAPVAGTTTTIDFSANNLAATSVVSGTYTLSGLKNGGAYTLVASANTNTATAVFTATGFTIIYMGTVAMSTAKQHIYSFIVVNNQVYVSMGTQN